MDIPSGSGQDGGRTESLLKQAEMTGVRQGASNAQVTQRNQPAQNGFHSAGTPPVPVEGYQPPEQSVDISLCDGDHCQSESLDAVKPAERT